MALKSPNMPIKRFPNNLKRRGLSHFLLRSYSAAISRYWPRSAAILAAIPTATTAIVKLAAISSQ
uniref:Uncharacterized protein n=1 Tax=Lotus japonicus TaxID=34305 RepID=I3T0Y1_LOTJA|nr:unknown [Lotus japonicus]